VRILGRLAVVLDQRRNFLELERAGFGDVGKARGDEGLSLGVNSLGDLPPARNLLGAVDARCLDVALPSGVIWVASVMIRPADARCS
jgi:hypothetical protein